MRRAPRISSSAPSISRSVISVQEQTIIAASLRAFLCRAARALNMEKRFQLLKGPALLSRAVYVAILAMRPEVDRPGRQSMRSVNQAAGGADCWGPRRVRAVAPRGGVLPERPPGSRPAADCGAPTISSRVCWSRTLMNASSASSTIWCRLPRALSLLVLAHRLDRAHHVADTDLAAPAGPAARHHGGRVPRPGSQPWQGYARS